MSAQTHSPHAGDSVTTMTAEVDPAVKRALSGAGAEEQRRLAPPDFTFRHVWNPGHGWITTHVTHPSITEHSNVFASISEVDERVDSTHPVVEDPMLGAAHCTVHNVVPYNGAVHVVVHIDWPTPVYFQISYLVIKS
jgi:hypothetical protein